MANAMGGTVLHRDTVIQIEGDGADAILLLHGWPDTAALWDRQVAALAPHFRCIRFTWPGFEPGAAHREHSLDSLIALCEAAARQASPGRPVTLLLHDWGCLFGYQFALRHPELVSRVIGVDIGDAGSRAHRASMGLKGKLGAAAYQLWLAAAWRIGGGTGTAMTRWMARKMGVPAAPESLTVQKNYAYYSTWTGKFRDAKIFRPTCPMLFIYGTRKPFMFHSPKWAAEVEKKPGSRVVAMDTDHWPMLRQPDAFNQLVLDWLAPAQLDEDHHALPADL